jgi:hypothetical protein
MPLGCPGVKVMKIEMLETIYPILKKNQRKNSLVCKKIHVVDQACCRFDDESIVTM